MSEADTKELTGTEPAVDADDRNVVARLADMGSVAQASVPALYAWAVTVAPVAWARGGGGFARAASIAGVLALGVAVFFERTDRPRAARLVSVWGLVLTSAIVWMAAPALASANRIDMARGISGMLGWGLFAYASAAPTYRRSAARPLFEGELRARAASPKGDRYYLLAAALAAIGLQFLGWYARTDDRALLVRLVTLGASIGIVSSAVHVALARHKRGRAASPKARRVATIRALGAIAVVTLVGIVLTLLR